MLKVSEGYLVGVDISEHDEAVVQVVAIEGTTRKLVNSFVGDDAVRLYELLTNKGEYELVKKSTLLEWENNLKLINENTIKMNQTQTLLEQKLKHIKDNYDLVPKK